MTQNVLAYVDGQLLIHVATGLIGSEIQMKRESSSTMGFNFKVLVSRAETEGHVSTTRVDMLLPELLADAVKDAVPHGNRVSTLANIRERLVAGSTHGLKPGALLLVEQAKLEPSPEASPAGDLLSGERCQMMHLRSGDFFLRAFVAHDHAMLLTHLSAQPIEALGVLKWTTPYEAPGSMYPNLGFRVCCAWLR